MFNCKISKDHGGREVPRVVGFSRWRSRFMRWLLDKPVVPTNQNNHSSVTLVMRVEPGILSRMARDLYGMRVNDSQVQIILVPERVHVSYDN